MNRKDLPKREFMCRPEDSMWIRAFLSCLLATAALPPTVHAGDGNSPADHRHPKNPRRLPNRLWISPSFQSNRSLADVWDISLDLSLRYGFSVTTYYAHAWGKSLIANIYPGGTNAQFGYVETTFRY